MNLKISQSEKQQILEMHKNPGVKNYLNEEEKTPCFDEMVSLITDKGFTKGTGSNYLYSWYEVDPSGKGFGTQISVIFRTNGTIEFSVYNNSGFLDKANKVMDALDITNDVKNKTYENGSETYNRKFKYSTPDDCTSSEAYTFLSKFPS